MLADLQSQLFLAQNKKQIPNKKKKNQSSILTLGDAGCSAKLSCNCCLPKLCLLYLVVILSMVWVIRQSMCVAIWISVPCVPGIWCRRLRYPRWWQTYRICTAQHQLNNGPRRWFPTENPHVHIRNASVSLKKKTTTAKESNYSPLPRSFNILLNRITNLPEITGGVYTFCKQVSCFCMSSQTCRSNMSLPACSYYYCLTLKKNTTEYEAGVPLLWWSRLNVCLHVVSFFFSLAIFAQVLIPNRSFFCCCSLPASPSIWNTSVHVAWVTWSAEKSASLQLYF